MCRNCLMYQNIFLVISMMMFSCANSKPTSGEVLLKWGDGGGFSGVETTFTLWTDGKVDRNGTAIGRFKKSDIRQIKENLATLGIENIQWNQPGNMYQILEIPVQGSLHKLVWDPYQEDFPKSLGLFYNYLKHLQNKL